jgi:hypothetical protein
MAFWTVDIVAGTNPGDPATFVARNQTAPVGTLYAELGDNVSWNNATGQDHQPIQTNLVPPLGTLVWPVVTPGNQTSAYVVSGTGGTTISYTCLLHSSEQGSIVITTPPPPPTS